jgi:DNA-binding GntR family transcriptional regulator
MTPPGTFERVYAVLKERLTRGAFRPGDRLEPAALADELFASVTPIRDALHRLAGERLVEAPRQEGFRVPALSESRLRHLYAWHRDLLLLALMRRRGAVGEEAAGTITGELSEQRRLMFSTLAHSSGNPELAFAVESVGERLGGVEILADLLLDDVEAESLAIMHALHSGDTRLLRKQLLNYHRRRERIVPRLLECIQSR